MRLCQRSFRHALTAGLYPEESRVVKMWQLPVDTNEVFLGVPADVSLGAALCYVVGHRHAVRVQSEAFLRLAVLWVIGDENDDSAGVTAGSGFLKSAARLATGSEAALRRAVFAWPAATSLTVRYRLPRRLLYGRVADSLIVVSGGEQT